MLVQLDFRNNKYELTTNCAIGGLLCCRNAPPIYVACTLGDQLAVGKIAALAVAGGVSEATLALAHGSVRWTPVEALIRAQLRLNLAPPTPPHRPFVQFMSDAGLIQAPRGFKVQPHQEQQASRYRDQLQRYQQVVLSFGFFFLKWKCQ